MTTSDQRLTRIAPAKVNLTLHLTGLREDGYHLLESFVVFTELGDTVQAKPSDALSLTVDGQLADGVPTDDTNLVLKAAHLLRDLRGVSVGAALHLTKHLPHGAGIGGGSSDAAAAIHLLAELWNVPPLTAAEALPLGADVPVCLCSPHATLMRGIGEQLTPAPYQPQGWLVLVNPRVVVPTRTVFDLHDTLYGVSPAGMSSMERVTTPDDFDLWLLQQRNDLTKVAREPSIAPIIGDVLAALDEGSADADMSGSGSTCWGLFWDQNTAQSTAARIAKDHPDWWVKASRILP